MNRRQSLKAIGISTISTGILLGACKTDSDKSSVAALQNDDFGDTDTTGLEEFEKERLKELNKKPAFFTDHETYKHLYLHHLQGFLPLATVRLYACASGTHLF